MKIILRTLCTACILLPFFAHADLVACPRPADGNWSAYCECFLNDAVTACNTCGALTQRNCSSGFLDYSIKKRLTDSMKNSECGKEVDYDLSHGTHNCVTAGTDVASCISDINAYQQHC